MVVQVKHWCFTINNYTDKELEICQLIDAEYIAWALEEAPSTGTPHIQGYISLAKKITMGGLAKRFNKKAHLSPAHGTPQENRKYIFGPWVSKCGAKQKPANSTARERGRIEEVVARGSDLENFKAWVKDENRTWTQALDLFSDLCSTRRAFCAEYLERFTPKNVVPFDVKPLYPWQQELLNAIAIEDSNRALFWVYEEAGNVGKSHMAEHLKHVVGGWQSYETQKEMNEYVFDWEECDVVIDLGRSKPTPTTLNFVEALKKGNMKCSKYMGRLKQHPKRSATVVFFSNFPPPWNSKSLDRWRCFKIVENHLERCFPFVEINHK